MLEERTRVSRLPLVVEESVLLVSLKTGPTVEGELPIEAYRRASMLLILLLAVPAVAVLP